MTVYVDQLFPTTKSPTWPYAQACHLMTDGPVEELHAFARRLSLKAEWFQRHVNERYCHYDLTAGMRAKALKLGAREITDGQQFLAVLNKEVDKEPEPLMTVLVGQRYEYTLLKEHGQYFVLCRDIERGRHKHKHGPFTEEAAQKMIEDRLKRDEALKR